MSAPKHVVNVNISRPDPSLVARFRALKTEVLLPLLPEPLLMDGAIRPLLNEWAAVGPAVTVAPTGTDMMMSIAATGIAQPGDVIVVAAGGLAGDGYAAWGGGLTLSARHKDVAGVVVDGFVQDAPAIQTREVPVFCRGSTLRYRMAAKPGSVNVPVSCGGVTVHPGDLVIADRDGVMVIPQNLLEDIIEAAEERTAYLARNQARMREEKLTLFDLRGGPELFVRAGVEWNDK